MSRIGVASALLCVCCLGAMGWVPSHAAQPILTITPGGEPREYPAAVLAARSDCAELSVPQDAAYNKPMVYRAVPLLALLGKNPETRFDTLEARASDGFIAQIPLELITRGARDGAVAWLAIEEPAHPWPLLPHQARSAGPFYLVWEHPERSSVRGEQWPYALVSLALVESPAHRWPQLSLPPDHAGDDRARAGQKVFVSDCLPCHQLNGAGGAGLGPDLGRPMNATQYLTEAGLRALIRNPRAVRTWPGQHMPGFDQTKLPEADLDAVVAYLRAMAAKPAPARIN